jgi:hypothetical protein
MEEYEIGRFTNENYENYLKLQQTEKAIHFAQKRAK